MIEVKTLNQQLDEINNSDFFAKFLKDPNLWKRNADLNNGIKKLAELANLVEKNIDSNLSVKNELEKADKLKNEFSNSKFDSYINGFEKIRKAIDKKIENDDEFKRKYFEKVIHEKLYHVWNKEKKGVKYMELNKIIIKHSISNNYKKYGFKEFILSEVYKNIEKEKPPLDELIKLHNKRYENKKDKPKFKPPRWYNVKWYDIYSKLETVLENQEGPTITTSELKNELKKLNGNKEIDAAHFYKAVKALIFKGAVERHKKGTYVVSKKREADKLLEKKYNGVLSWIRQLQNISFHTIKDCWRNTNNKIDVDSIIETIKKEKSLNKRQQKQLIKIWEKIDSNKEYLVDMKAMSFEREVELLPYDGVMNEILELKKYNLNLYEEISDALKYTRNLLTKTSS